MSTAERLLTLSQAAESSGVSTKTLRRAIDAGDLDAYGRKVDALANAITSQVKTRLLADKRVPGTKIKVVTEAAVVYLMGLMKRAEAATATEIARTTSGVTRVVVLFEFID